ncbi:nitronate monooxygenase [Streptomyces sp. NBC_00984]|nr:nitronate monooxygenase [Streptomyces sp. NBC_00984]
MLPFGDSSPFAERIRAAGAALIVQVTNLEEARMAVDLGADVIVAQGTESGGHGARRGRATLPFVSVVADLAAPVPVPAAEGIADGRGAAAALVLGGRRRAHRYPFPGHGRVPGRFPRPPRRSSAGRTRNAAASSTSPGEPVGRRRSTRLAPSAIPTSTAGGEGRRNSPRTHRSDMPIGPMCRRCRYGPVRASTSSTICHPQPISLSHWPPRRRAAWPEQEGTDRSTPEALAPGNFCKRRTPSPGDSPPTP